MQDDINSEVKKLYELCKNSFENLRTNASGNSSKVINTPITLLNSTAVLTDNKKDIELKFSYNVSDFIYPDSAKFIYNQIKHGILNIPDLKFVTRDDAYFDRELVTFYQAGKTFKSSPKLIELSFAIKDDKFHIAFICKK